MGVQVIPIPLRWFRIPSHSHSQFCVLFPFPWDSHGIPCLIGNPIPMHISNTELTTYDADAQTVTPISLRCSQHTESQPAEQGAAVPEIDAV